MHGRVFHLLRSQNTYPALNHLFSIKTRSFPMDFAVSEKMQIIIKMIDEFVEKELIPLEPEFLTRPTSELLPRLRKSRNW